MDEVPEIIKDFGQVFCGIKAVEHVKIRNTSKKVQGIIVVPAKEDKILYGRLRINPRQAVAPPGKPVRLTLTYLSKLENLTDIMSYYIFECDKLVARLKVEARTLGPCIPSKTYNIKFFRFCHVNQTVRNVTLENLNQCEAKFYFDLDESYKQIQISQTHGVLPAKSKLNLKIVFNSPEPGIYYKTIFCLLQYHPPLMFNVLSICQPSSRIEPKNLTLRYPLEIRPECNYVAYMEKLKIEYTPEGEKFPFLQKCATERDCLSGTTNAEMEEEMCLSPEDYDQYQNKNKQNKSPIEVFLTTYFIDVKNQAEILRGTTLVNLSKCQRYYYVWDQDPNYNFRIHPDRGIIEPNMKTYFNIYFSPPESDFLYHAEIDLRVFPCDCESKVADSDTVDLPLTQSLRVLGNSFPDDSCIWMAQCAIVPKTLQLPSCVPEENVFGTFMIERRGHLPVSFSVTHSKETNYSVQPPLGYLSRDYQLFVIEFSAKSKEEGVYAEDVKIFFNNSESVYETLKVATSVEIPKLNFGKNNTHTFTPVCPGARTSETISIKNPTNLKLSYEFKTPEDVTWYEVVDPTGVIEPNCFSEVTVTFKPNIPCKYTGSLPCSVSSISKMDYVKIVHLRLVGSCEYGYLVATPSVHDYGECLYLEQKSIKINLFNFSPVLINFQLTTVHKSFPPGDAKQDVIITPDRGTVPGKCSLEVEVAVIPHDKDTFQYAILCQNLADDSENSQTCDDARIIFSLRFEGVVPTMQIIDVSIEGGGKLFSPHWVWKMMNINRINRGLNSLERELIVDSVLPEAPVDSPPIIITLLLEANRHGNFHCHLIKKFNCPCFQASEGYLNISCIHSVSVNITPSSIDLTAIDVSKTCTALRRFAVSRLSQVNFKRKQSEVLTKLLLRANERAKLQFSISYEDISVCSFEWALALYNRRKVIVRTKTSPFSTIESLPVASMYLNPIFRLKPVFIGDNNPPLQLFWLYNNNDQPAAYNVVNVALWKETSNDQKILECINPNGVLPPFSSLPLAFLFRPNELRSFVGEVTLKLHEKKTEILRLEGDGTPIIQQNIQLTFEKTLPKKPILKYPGVDIKCVTNCVFIDFQRTFSKAKRIFAVENNSSTVTWSFRWHSFKVDNIISAHIHPSEGRIEPGQKTVMTVTVESFSYATSTSFSVPCDVINYSALKAYEEAVRLQEIMTEKAKDCFTITEKGITYETPDIEIPEKPQVHHIFITLKVNIFSNQNVDEILRPKQELRMKGETDVGIGPLTDAFLKTSELPIILHVFEKKLWNIINKKSFWRKIKCANPDFKYLQLLPESRKKKQEYNSTPIKVTYIQSLFETELKEILTRKFISTTEERKVSNEYKKIEFIDTV